MRYQARLAFTMYPGYTGDGSVGWTTSTDVSDGDIHDATFVHSLLPAAHLARVVMVCASSRVT